MGMTGQDTDEKLASFAAWLAEAGVTLSPAVELVSNARDCSGLALGVKAVSDIAQGELLCTIPKAACLSIRNTAISDLIEKEHLGGGLGLVLVVMYEMALGHKSKWHGYLQALPPREYLPVHWNEEEVELLVGTEAEDSAQADRMLMAADFEEHVVPLLSRYPDRLQPAAGFTLERFGVAASYVASRAFGIDDYHGDAMVPVADIFNHKASVVALDPAYAVHGMDDSDSDTGDEAHEDDDEEEDVHDDREGRDEVEEKQALEREKGMEGALGQAGSSEGDQGYDGHQEDSSHAGAGSRDTCDVSDSEGEEQGTGGTGAGLPGVLSEGQHVRCGLTHANGLHLRLEIAIVDGEDRLQIVAASPVAAGSEVHNTYGEHGNAELVCKYGFALRQNPFTTVEVNKQLVLEAAEAMFGKRHCRQRCRFLRAHTRVLAQDADGDEEEPFEVLPNGHINPPLFVALRVLIAPDDEAANWQGITDALTAPGGGKPSAELHAVQLWPVANEQGVRMTTAEAATVAAARREQQPGLEQLVTPAMCKLAAAVAAQRLLRYRCPLKQSLAQLDAAAADSRNGPLGEHRAALHAALQLRVSEQEVLDDLLHATQQRLAALLPRCRTDEPAGVLASPAEVSPPLGHGRKRKSRK